jgi:hypothetical protein
VTREYNGETTGKRPSIMAFSKTLACPHCAAGSRAKAFGASKTIGQQAKDKTGSDAATDLIRNHTC